MKKQTPNYYNDTKSYSGKSYYDNAHNYRRQSVHSLFFILLWIIAMLAFLSCTPVKKTGCEYLYKNKRKFTAWIKHSNSDKVFILDKDGSIICCYTSK